MMMMMMMMMGVDRTSLRPSQSHSATDDQSFRLNVKIFSWSALPRGIISFLPGSNLRQIANG